MWAGSDKKHNSTNNLYEIYFYFLSALEVVSGDGLDSCLEPGLDSCLESGLDSDLELDFDFLPELEDVFDFW